MADDPKTHAGAVALMREMERLLGLAEENPFKVRAFRNAQESLEGVGDLEERARAGTLTEIPGIGKGIAEVLAEYLLHGKTTARDEIRASLPAGLEEIVRVPGLGPKKARALIDELGIHSLAELEYACRENRILRLKGFGEKMQDKILEGIRFVTGTLGKVRIPEALELEAELLAALAKVAGRRVEPTGALRRRQEVVSKLSFLVEIPDRGAEEVERKVWEVLRRYREKGETRLEVDLAFAPAKRFGYELAHLTGSVAHWKALGEPKAFEAREEEEFYDKLGLPWIPPEMRETGEEVALARSGRIGDVLAEGGIAGVFHNHTTRSDGTATLEEMVEAAEKLGYRYIGISDHSQSSTIAGGLKAAALKEQEREIRAVQEKYPGIRVFWGIECDIKADGTLDYDDKTLARFDFVIASVHQRFKMEREAMTDRIVEAIRHPSTRMLGHSTGRLLLGRPGYDLDMERVIREAAKHDVAIEINAHPARLDIDWRWGGALRAAGTRVSVNPDAHSVEGLKDTSWGVLVARKALLSKDAVVNARSAAEVEKWLRRA